MFNEIPCLLSGGSFRLDGGLPVEVTVRVRVGDPVVTDNCVEEPTKTIHHFPPRTRADSPSWTSSFPSTKVSFGSSVPLLSSGPVSSMTTW